MNLTTDAISKLDSLAQTALSAGIKKFVITEGQIRGINDLTSVIIITKDNIPDLDGKHLAVNRIDSLVARLNLLKTQGDVEITTIVNDKTDNINVLDFKSGKTKVQLRCGALDAISKGIPKGINDEMVWKLKLGVKAINTIGQGITAMGALVTTIASKDGKAVTVEMLDTNNDVFSVELEEVVEWIGTGDPEKSFCYKYPSKILISLLKDVLKCGTSIIDISIGKGGMMTFKVNGFDFYIIPTARS